MFYLSDWKPWIRFNIECWRQLVWSPTMVLLSYFWRGSVFIKILHFQRNQFREAANAFSPRLNNINFTLLNVLCFSLLFFRDMIDVPCTLYLQSFFWHGIRHATLDVLCETVYDNTYPAGLGAQWHVHVLLPQRLPTIKCRTNILLESFLHVEFFIVP